MFRKVINWLSSLKKSFNHTKETPVKIPIEIDHNERIVRSIYSPMNITKKGTLNANAFKSPPDIDEISVNRLDYTTPDFCKNLSKKNESTNRTYFGFAILTKNEIFKAGCDIVYSPITLPLDKINPFHADIKIGYIPQRGQQLPSEFQKKANDLTKSARLYSDPNPNSLTWDGGELI